MAKTQNLTLNPAKISGICGRLMCCLRYENDYYEEMGEIMPNQGDRVMTVDGQGVVIASNAIKKSVLVELEEEKIRKEFKICELEKNG
jgi:cell fate regulator YaaT (PSP1 superfamily)